MTSMGRSSGRCTRTLRCRRSTLQTTAAPASLHTRAAARSRGTPRFRSKSDRGQAARWSPSTSKSLPTPWQMDGSGLRQPRALRLKRVCQASSCRVRRVWARDAGGTGPARRRCSNVLLHGSLLRGGEARTTNGWWLAMETLMEAGLA